MIYLVLLICGVVVAGFATSLVLIIKGEKELNKA